MPSTTTTTTTTATNNNNNKTETKPVKSENNKKYTTENNENTEETDNTDKIRGYKLTTDGRKTTFFNNEMDEQTRALIGDIAPQKISPQDNGGDVVPSNGGSVWNAAGTFESVDHCKLYPLVWCCVCFYSSLPFLSHQCYRYVLSHSSFFFSSPFLLPVPLNRLTTVSTLLLLYGVKHGTLMIIIILFLHNEW